MSEVKSNCIDKMADCNSQGSGKQQPSVSNIAGSEYDIREHPIKFLEAQNKTLTEGIIALQNKLDKPQTQLYAIRESQNKKLILGKIKYNREDIESSMVWNDLPKDKFELVLLSITAEVVKDGNR